MGQKIKEDRPGEINGFATSNEFAWLGISKGLWIGPR
jgi:hypothetical protein